jgi:hypothetical protein
LVDVEQLPAPPEVTDVTDRVAELRDAAPATWDARHALVGTALAIGVLSAGTGTALATLLGGGAALVLLVLTTLAATLAGLLTRLPAATLLLGAALGSVVPVAVWLSGVLAEVVPVGPLGVPALVVALAWLVLALGAGIGRRSPAVALGASTGVLLTLAAGVPPLFGVDLVATAAVVAALAIVMLGLLPSLAVAASGLGSLDDEVIAGRLPGRDRVAASLADAFRVTTWAVVAIAIWLGPSIAALLASGDLWPMLLGGAVALVTALRTRVVPMAVPTWALWTAAVGGSVVGVGLAPGIPTGVLLGLCVVAAVALIVLVVARPSVQTRIRLRRAGDLLEMVAAVAIPPFLLGVFGVYAALLEVLA